ncbi:MAG TPA: winged helix DNA-binding domain-containing protein [Anaerolineales bacterium]|nr:winged helix DNA-binding domain-containing protein [Anaerolineales bacterium]
MTNLDIIRYRLHNQLLSQIKFTQPSQVVAWFGAIQAQDYAGAKWAIGQRVKGMTDSAVEQALADGSILRTHVMRPTWHFVTPTDIRWMLELTAPRVRAAMAHMDRQLELDKAIFKKSNAVLTKTLHGNQQLTRSELAPVLQKTGVPVDGLRLGHLLMHAELDGVICSGARKGKQFTYALLEERAPQSKILERSETLAELTKRYFRSHGPATLQDFAWWSGLTMTDVRKGIEEVKSELEHEVSNNQTYWFPPTTSLRDLSPAAYLLSNYDEYTVGYRDRSAIFDVSHTDKLSAFRESILTQTILINGEVSGTWKRTVKKSEVIIQLAPFSILGKTENQAVIEAAQQYGKFLGLPAVLAI